MIVQRRVIGGQSSEPLDVALVVTSRPMSRLSVAQGDITRLSVDVIVNAANEALLGGGGVDGAIHRAAGPELLAACRELGQVRPGVRCPTGEARATSGFRLPARWVVHTVGPVWYGGTRGEAELLAACYNNALALSVSLGARSVAFPAISCGVYGFPVEAAAQIAAAECGRFLQRNAALSSVVLVAFESTMAGVIERAVARQLDGRGDGNARI